MVVEYDDGTDYGGSETYSFEDERYGGGGRRREGQATYERTTQRSFGPYSCMKHEVKTWIGVTLPDIKSLFFNTDFTFDKTDLVCSATAFLTFGS